MENKVVLLPEEMEEEITKRVFTLNTEVGVREPSTRSFRATLSEI